MGRAAEALPFTRKVAKIRGCALPAGHPEVAASQLTLAEALKDVAQ